MVFIRHSHEASEVGEQEFFYGRELGGTIVSTALKKLIEVRDRRYSASEWNVYCAQVSDGDNSGSDTQGCVALLNELILPLTQYFAYIEICRSRRPRSPVRGRQRQGALAGLRGVAGRPCQFCDEDGRGAR